MLNRAAAFVLCSATVLVAACGGGDGGGDTTPPRPTPAFTLAVSPNALTVQAGGTVNSVALDESALAAAAAIAEAGAGTGIINVTISRSGGFEGSVALTVEGLPTGVTASALSIGAGQSTGTITITAAANAAVGNSTLTVRGTGTGVSAQTATVQLTISPPPSFALALIPPTLSIPQGQSGTSTANITRANGFTGAVNLTSSGAPAGMTVTLNPTSVTGTSSAITVAVANTVAAGTYSVTIQGTGAGVSNQTATLSVTVTATPTGSIALALAPASLTLQQNQSGTSTLTITRTNFTGAVSLSSGGSPPGMNITFNPASPTGTTSTITVDVGSTVVTGTYNVTITASGTGIANATATLTLTVTPMQQSISMTTNPATLTIQAGQAATTNLTITRTNFAGSVNLTGINLPSGITVAFNPSATTGNTSTVTVTVASNVAAGQYTVTLQGAGTGISNATFALGVTVTAPPGGTGNTTWTFCEQSGTPLWFAYQNLGGAWTQVVAANHVYRFDINPRGAVAWVMQEGSRTRLTIYYGSQADLSAQGTSFCTAGGTSKTINGTVQNLGANESARIQMGAGTAFVLGNQATAFQLTNVQDGLLDLIGVRSAPLFPPSVPNSIVIQRDLNVANNGSVTVNFAQGVAPVQRTATIANLLTQNAMFISTFLSSRGTAANISFDAQPSNATTRTWYGVPSGSVMTGDWHQQNILATDPASQTGFPFRSVAVFNRQAADQTYTLPDPIATPPTITTNATAPYVTFTSRWTIQSSQYNNFWAHVFEPVTGTAPAVTIMGTSGYFGSGPVLLTLPTFGANFNPAHAPQPGTQHTWTFLASGGTAWTLGNTPTALEGAVSNTSGVAGTYTP